jgi:hypothetical protein
MFIPKTLGTRKELYQNLIIVILNEEVGNKKKGKLLEDFSL